jgi:ABC-type antimicrobial peptide transport system permease subunit
LISVRERVREIGIRKLLGVDDGAILRLFLAESLTLAFLGAIAGTLGGIGLILVTERFGAAFGKPFSIPINLPGAVIAVANRLRLVPGPASSSTGPHPGDRRGLRPDPL